jgi:hypothetical protein
MSKIVNVGIQQGGVKNSAPDAISQNGLTLMTAFMTGGEKQLVQENYVSVSAADSNEKGKTYASLYPNAEASLYVKKDADDGQVETGQYFRSLSAALIAMSGKYLSHWVSIVMTCADYYEGYISISGIAGGGTLKIFGNGSRLRATEIQFYDCALNISIDGIELYQRLATTHGIYADACNYLSLTNSKFYALSTTATNYGAITVAAGTGLYVNNCELYGVWRAILLRLSAHGVSYNNKGTASLSVSSGILIAEGTQPCASPTFGYSRGYGGVLEQSGTITVDQGAGATAPVVETETFAMTTVHTVYGTGDWPGTWMNETSYTWQGYTSTNKHEATLLWASGAAFAALAASNVTILEARLRIKRVSSIGVGDDVKVKAYYGSKSKTAGSGSPSSLVSIGSLGTISNGETAEFTIPTAAIKYLAGSPDGRCLALNPLDSSVLSGKSYSANYCKFYGLGGSVPELIVTYQTA